MVVEDEPIIRVAIADYLRDEGYAVLEANTGAAAREMVSECGCLSAVFSDIQMPGPLDGVALIRWLLDVRPEVALILTSGRLRNDDFPDLPVRIVPKPYDFACVGEMISSGIADAAAGTVGLDDAS